MMRDREEEKETNNSKNVTMAYYKHFVCDCDSFFLLYEITHSQTHDSLNSSL